jgi:hypothetical protein
LIQIFIIIGAIEVCTNNIGYSRMYYSQDNRT